MEKYSVSEIYNACASDSLKDDMRNIANGNMDMVVLNPAYTDYGGDIWDKALIEWCKQEYPDNIIVEKTSWNGENAFVFGKAMEDYMENNYCLEDTICEIEQRYVEEDTLPSIMEQYHFDDKDLEKNVRSAICLALYENGSSLATGWDYYEPEIIKQAEKIMLSEDGIEINLKDYEI